MSIFTARSHQTRIGQSLSDLAELLSGVIHGSGIGPVLVIFIDTLAELLEAHNIKSKMFADDVKVYMSVLNADDAATFHTALNIISDWAQDWQL